MPNCPRIALPLLVFGFGCADADRCVEGYGTNTSALQRGGWDGNGPALFGTDVAVNGERTAGGSIDEGLALVGRTLEISRNGTTRTIEVLSAETDPNHASRVLYSITVDGKPACAPGEHGVFVRGSYGEDTRYTASDEVSFACEHGAIAKCDEHDLGPSAGAELHQTCIRLTRADYCGDGRSFTSDGTQIAIFSGDEPELAADFEAGWGPDGAVCVNRLRFTAFSERGDELLPECLAGIPTCGDPSSAMNEGATLLNASMKHMSLVACED